MGHKGKKSSSSSDSNSSGRSSEETTGKKRKTKEKKKVKKMEKKKKDKKEMKKLESKERIREGKELGVKRRKAMAIAATNPFEQAAPTIPPPQPGCTRADFGFLDKYLGLDIELHGKKGAFVRRVAPGSVAEKKGIAQNCMIQGLNGAALPASMKELEDLLKKRPLIVDFSPPQKDSKEDKRLKKEKKKIVEAESKRREELQNHEDHLQNGKNQASSEKTASSKADVQEKRESPGPSPSPRESRSRSESSKKQKTMVADKDLRRMAHSLMESEPGAPPSSESLALKLLTKQQCVAWQWRNSKGVMQYPVPIGSNKPLSPFSDTDC